MSATSPSFDSPEFRRALGRFATGVTIVTSSKADGSPVGLTVSSFNSVSLDPPLVVWSLSRGSSSLATFERCDRYVIQVLGADQMLLANKFARGSHAERFNGVPLTQAPNGTARLDMRCAAWFECFNRSRYDEGDHIVFVGQVEHCAHTEALPLVYHAGGYDLTPNMS
ncbi:flavin reductase family protein [Orrella sp. NBD-18]|uniref:Flavin reductase family protein n=1 Tax=Sheuella amnicola TaxID=2707330 RepID=A0A6B2R6Q0_9BURK|nr:flavin reductase family protein [Sheuella amnicola]NDY83005.1 flavin reductase family protein [Sheuella amnicola]